MLLHHSQQYLAQLEIKKVSCWIWYNGCFFTKGGKFHLASQGLREEIERVSRELHKWEPYNVDQLVSAWRGENH